MPKRHQPELPPRLCEKCGNPFIPRRHWQKYCTRFCTQAAYWERVNNKLRDDPTAVLETPMGTSEARQAEYDRRASMSVFGSNPPPPPIYTEDNEHAKRLAEEAEKIMEKNSILEQLYGDKK